MSKDVKAGTFPDLSRLAQGFGWGVVATVAMSIPMVLGFVTGLSPMPMPVPMAIVREILGAQAPQAILILSTLVSHLAYGGFWAAVLAAIVRPVTVWAGLALGIFLWLVMQVLVLPFVGWGFFGLAVTPAIALATLILHLIYGTVLGWLLD